MRTKKKPARKATARASGRDAAPRRPGHRSAMPLPKTAQKKSRIAVLIADDHSVVREGLASLIGRKADMTVLAEAANGREAVELWK